MDHGLEPLGWRHVRGQATQPSASASIDELRADVALEPLPGDVEPAELRRRRSRPAAGRRRSRGRRAGRAGAPRRLRRAPRARGPARRRARSSTSASAAARRSAAGTRAPARWSPRRRSRAVRLGRRRHPPDRRPPGRSCAALAAPTGRRRVAPHRWPGEARPAARPRARGGRDRSGADPRASPTAGRGACGRPRNGSRATSASRASATASPGRPPEIRASRAASGASAMPASTRRRFDLAPRDGPEPDPDAARPDRGQEALLVGGREDEDGAGGRLLERLEERRLGVLGHPVRGDDDRDARAALDGHERQLADEVAHAALFPARRSGSRCRRRSARAGARPGGCRARTPGTPGTSRHGRSAGSSARHSSPAAMSSASVALPTPGGPTRSSACGMPPASIALTAATAAGWPRVRKPARPVSTVIVPSGTSVRASWCVPGSGRGLRLPARGPTLGRGRPGGVRGEGLGRPGRVGVGGRRLGPRPGGRGASASWCASPRSSAGRSASAASPVAGGTGGRSPRPARRRLRLGRSPGPHRSRRRR